MVNRTRGWLQHVPAALVWIGWLSFAAAIVTQDPLIKALFLVAARALPHPLNGRPALGFAGYGNGYGSRVKSCPSVATRAPHDRRLSRH
jgi:hypothetical protein